MAIQPISVAPKIKPREEGGSTLGAILGGIAAAGAIIATAGAATPAAPGMVAAGSGAGATAAAGTGAAAAGATGGGVGLSTMMNAFGGGSGIGSLVGGILKKESPAEQMPSTQVANVSTEDMGPISRRLSAGNGGLSAQTNDAIRAAMSTPGAQSPEIMNPLLAAQSRFGQYQKGTRRG